MFRGTADSPKGADGDGDRDRSLPSTRVVPKPRTTTSMIPPAMTLEEVAEIGNLMTAFEKVASNRGAPGPNRQTIEEVRTHLDALLPGLSESIFDETYRPGMIRRVWIPKSGGGERGLGIPDVVDRIVQQAVHQVLNPHLEPRFHPSSHGFRPGRSCHTAIAEAKAYLEEGYEWLVDIDLSKFFDRVHHERLLARLEHQGVSDRRVLQLIRRMLKAKVVLPDGVVVGSEEGTPQGGPLSPLLSNVVLDELDRELSRRGHRFVRYADDCNIYVRSERAGKRVMAGVTKFIEGRLRLKVNQDKSAVARPGKRHFLGFRLVRQDTGRVEVRLSARSTERVVAKLRELTPRNWGRPLDECIVEVNQYIRGWVSFFSIIDEEERRWLQRCDARIRRRLRAIKLKHWKRKRHIAKNLIRMGARRHTVWKHIYRGRQSIWALSHCYIVDITLNTAFFAAKGLISIAEEWQRFRPNAIAPTQLTLALG